MIRLLTRCIKPLAATLLASVATIAWAQKTTLVVYTALETDQIEG